VPRGLMSGQFGKQKRGLPRRASRLTFFLLFSFSFSTACEGDSYPGICAQRTPGGGGSLTLFVPREAGTGFLCLSLLFWLHIPKG